MYIVFATEGFLEVALSQSQLALRANFVQLLQFHLFVECSRFISVFAFVSHHICFK